MPPDEFTHLREMSGGHGRKHGRADFVEMQMPDQVETGCAKNMCILQQLHRLPSAVLHERGQRCGGDGHHDGAAS